MQDRARYSTWGSRMTVGSQDGQNHKIQKALVPTDKQFTNSEVSLTSSEISPRFIQFGVSQFQGPQILHSSWLIQNLAPKWLPPQVRQQSGNQGEERFRIHTAFLVSAYEMQNKHQDLRARRNLPSARDPRPPFLWAPHQRFSNNKRQQACREDTRRRRRKGC